MGCQRAARRAVETGHSYKSPTYGERPLARCRGKGVSGTGTVSKNLADEPMYVRATPTHPVNHLRVTRNVWHGDSLSACIPILSQTEGGARLTGPLMTIIRLLVNG